MKLSRGSQIVIRVGGWVVRIGILVSGVVAVGAFAILFGSAILAW